MNDQTTAKIVIENVKRMCDDDLRLGDQELFHCVTFTGSLEKQAHVCVSGLLQAAAKMTAEDVDRLIRSFAWTECLQSARAMEGYTNGIGWKYTPSTKTELPRLMFVTYLGS